MKNLKYFTSSLSKITYSFIALFAFILLQCTVPAFAAEFITNDESGNITLTDTTVKHENSYLAGQSITVKTPIGKDLFVAGSNVIISSSVERSGYIAGSTILISDSTFGAGIKVAGSNIVIENVTIEEDAFFAGSSLTLKNVTIKGDLILVSGSVIMEGSVVEKNMYYSGPTNNSSAFKTQVKGNFYEDSSLNSNSNKNSNIQKNSNLFFSFEIAQAVSSLVILGIEIYLLNKYNRLRDRRISFKLIGKDGNFFTHFGLGLLTILGIIVLFVISIISIGLLAPFGINLAIILSLLFFLLCPLTSYYIANLIFGDKILWWHPLLVLLVVLILTNLPSFGIIFSSIFVIFAIANTGYYLGKDFRSKIAYLKSGQDLELEETVDKN
jgi:carbonic anhydrase/acetyltransferase-like protein (isoleucine patch superfamily)